MKGIRYTSNVHISTRHFIAKLSFHFNIVDVNIVFSTSGILLVSRQTKAFPAGSFLAKRSAWSPKDPMKIAKALTSFLRERILPKFVGEMP